MRILACLFLLNVSFLQVAHAIAPLIALARHCAGDPKGEGLSHLFEAANLSPGSKELNALVKEIEKLRSIENFPLIPFDSMRGSLVERTRGKGMRHFAIYDGSFEGNRIAIKVSEVSDRVLNEARFLMILNKVGLGPRFRGLSKGPGNRLAIVMDYIEGQAVDTINTGFDGRFLPKGLSITRETLSQIENAGRVLHQLGVRYAGDLEFMITPSGKAIVVDPEFYSFEIPSNNKHKSRFYDPLEQSAEIVRNLKRAFPTLN